MKYFLLYLLVSLTVSNSADAQSIVGAWKMLSQVTLNEDGTEKDLTALQRKQWPCLADLQTIFGADGKQTMKLPAGCKSPMDYSKLPASTWTMKGNSITISNKSLPTPLGTSSSYTVTFSGKKAVFTHEYSTEEKAKLRMGGKIKRIVITYERV